MPFDPFFFFSFGLKLPTVSSVHYIGTNLSEIKMLKLKDSTILPEVGHLAGDCAGLKLKSPLHDQAFFSLPCVFEPDGFKGETAW